MKTLFVVMLLLVASTFNANAQFAFNLGPKVGYNSYTLNDNIDSVQANIKNSFQVGAFIRVGERLYFQPEANYQVSVTSLDKKTGATLLSQDITIKSLKVPALFGFKLINKGPFNLRILAGPAFSFTLDKKLNPASMNDLWPIQSVDDIKNNAWSVQMGAGMDVFFVTLDVRYEMGIQNLYNGNSNLQMKNNMFNVSLGIKLL